jgi:cell division protein ZapA
LYVLCLTPLHEQTEELNRKTPTEVCGDKNMNGESRSIRVSIFGKDYNVKGSSDNDHIKALAAHVDTVMRDVADRTGALSSGRVAILAALNIADEMYRERQHFEELIDDLTQKLGEVLGTGDI